MCWEDSELAWEQSQAAWGEGTWREGSGRLRGSLWDPLGQGYQRGRSSWGQPRAVESLPPFSLYLSRYLEPVGELLSRLGLCWELLGPDTHKTQPLSQVSSRKRKLSSDEGDSCSEEPDSTTPPSKNPKGDRKAPFRCRKCGYLASSSADFQEHIPQHRTDESSHQCRECGLCFTSQVSLNRHRFITHKKKKGAGEMEEPGPRSPLEGGAQHMADGKLSCKVCGRCFDSQLNLKTHFRTHGMAFIRARQNASPEN